MSKANINDMTIGEARELAALFGGGRSPECEGPWKVGTNYLIRTVTMAQTGRLVAVYPTELVLADAAWVGDTGRFAQAVEKADFYEVEPFPDLIIVGRQAIIDACEIPSLPREQK